MSNLEISDLDKNFIKAMLIKILQSELKESELEKLTEIGVKLEESSGKRVSEAERLEIRKELEEFFTFKSEPVSLETSNSSEKTLDKVVAEQECLLGRELSKKERVHLQVQVKKEEYLKNKKETDILVLHCSAYTGDLEIVKEYIEKKGVSVNALNEEGYNALFYAILADRRDTAQYLIKKGADFKPILVYLQKMLNSDVSI